MSNSDDTTSGVGYTPEALAAEMVRAGKRISVQAVRWHCRQTQGWLYGKAKRVGRVWLIPPDVAMNFAEKWEPWESMRKPK